MIWVAARDAPYDITCARRTACIHPVSARCYLHIRQRVFGCMWESPTLKGLDMTPQFLREEAARFRGLAGTIDREASKLRLLTMADDYASRAKAADELTEPNLGGAIKGNTGRSIIKAI
jgi:hypothetical protein